MTSTYNESAPGFSGNRATNTVTAFFDSRSEAENAIKRLKEAGVGDVRMMPGYEAESEGSPAPEHAGFWATLEDFLFPDDDRNVYAEGLRRGGFLVSASIDDATYEAAHAILDDQGAIDMDERADLWRTEGWTETREQQVVGSKDDVFQSDAAAVSSTGVGHYARRAEPSSNRVRTYELSGELPADVVDDVLPTGHQRDVSEGDRPVKDGMTQSQSIDDLRQRQSLPGSR